MGPFVRVSVSGLVENFGVGSSLGDDVMGAFGTKSSRPALVFWGALCKHRVNTLGTWPDSIISF